MQKFTVHSSWFIVLYVLGIVALFFYSFTQVDLSLTLSRASWVQDVQKSFQYIGYFNRPLSTYLFVGITVFLYLIYIKILFSIKSISKKQLWGIIIFSTIVLGAAYNAFSYDLFNYIFDAKIITYYQQNPYEHKALDYAGDPMLSFMRWTHRVYPYGPVWLGLTVPLSYVGMQYFVITLILFKALMMSAFLISVWCIGKILQHTYPKKELLGMAFFALNPFVLIESLVSAHNDIVVIAFLLGGVYLLIQKRYIATFLVLVLAYGIKFATVDISIVIHTAIIVGLGLGLFLFSKFLVKKKISWNVWFTIIGASMIVPIVLASLRTTFQPWYLLLVLPFAALLSDKYYIVVPTILLSLFALSEYLPFLFLGNWDPPVPQILAMLTFAGIIVALLSIPLIAGLKKIYKQ